jgi:hypothetical protein
MFPLFSYYFVIMSLYHFLLCVPSTYLLFPLLCPCVFVKLFPVIYVPIMCLLFRLFPLNFPIVSRWLFLPNYVPVVISLLFPYYVHMSLLLHQFLLCFPTGTFPFLQVEYAKEPHQLIDNMVIRVASRNTKNHPTGTATTAVFAPSFAPSFAPWPPGAWWSASHSNWPQNSLTDPADCSVFGLYPHPPQKKVN